MLKDHEGTTEKSISVPIKPILQIYIIKMTKKPVVIIGATVTDKTAGTKKSKYTPASEDAMVRNIEIARYRKANSK